MSEYKLIHAQLYMPHKKNIFGNTPRNARYKVRTISCCNSENCGLYSRGECSWASRFSWVKCPYGQSLHQTSYTMKAAKCSDWFKDMEERYKDVGMLRSYSERMATIGDYVFLPYTHMERCELVPFEPRRFLLLSEFTVTNIIRLVRARPMSILWNEITSYQKEVPPKFLRHLSEQMPDLFQKVIAADEYAEARYKEFANGGRYEA